MFRPIEMIGHMSVLIGPEASGSFFLVDSWPEHKGQGS